MSSFEHDVVIIGAGISGLAAARALHRAGGDVLVLERASTPGGRIHSERRDGFLFEHGPNSLVSPAPAAEALVASLGLQGACVERGDGVRNRYLVRGGRACALPIAPLRFFTSSFFSLPGRLRLLAEPFVAASAADESVGSFVRRRFGAELARYVFDPLVGGLYAGDPEQLSVEALFPHLKRLEREHGSVVRGVWAARRAGRRGFDPRSRRMFSFADGMATLPSAIVAELGARVRCSACVHRIEPCPGGWQLQLRAGDATACLRARCVVLATPAYAAARLLGPLHAGAASALASLDHPPLAVVGLAYPREQLAHALDGLGVLAPRAEQRGILGLIFSSTLFAGRAPADTALLTAYVGGARQPDLALLPRDDLLELVQGEVRSLLGARPDAQPVFASVRYWRHGLPQPGLDHAQRLQAIEQLQQDLPGLVLAGNYTGGVSTAACIAGGEAAAARICAAPWGEAMSSPAKALPAMASSWRPRVLGRPTEAPPDAPCVHPARLADRYGRRR